ncbi:DNA-binding transcriptional activator KdpE [Azospirillaceae bacterium]
MTEQGPVVLVIDDEPPFRRLLRAGLTAEGYRVIDVATGREALDRFYDSAPDLCILDLGLPDIDGLDLIQRFRQASQTPIVVLSSRFHEQAKIDALDLGADDYITKPFSMGELMARLRTALRHRIQEHGATPVVEIKSLRIDLVRSLVSRDGEVVRLSATEYRLLKALTLNAGKVMTHRQITQAVWGARIEKDPQYLRVYMRALRQKLEPDPARPIYILTEPGVGYRLHLDSTS